jgi:hypothetical protein
MSKETKLLNDRFEQIVEHYLVNCNSVRNTTHTQNVTPELEIRFGTNKNVAKPISIVDYKNVAENLLANGWTSATRNMEGNQMLRIIPERLMQGNQQKPHIDKDKNDAEKELSNEEAKDASKGGGARAKLVSSNIRAEIEGSHLIQYYCEHNDLQNMKRDAKFTKKVGVKNPSTNKFFERVDYEDFNFRVSYQEEEDYRITSTYHPITKTLYDWPSSKKTFRNINRVRFRHDEYPIFVDMSIIKTNRKNKVSRKKKEKRGSPIPTLTVQEAGVFNEIPVYEIEIELDNSKMSMYSSTSNKGVKELMNEIKKTIRFVLGGLQETPFPVCYSEQDQIIEAYMCRIHSDSWLTSKSPYPYFIGPQSVSLQLDNVQNNEDMLSSTTSIQNKYTVTEKADGQRSLLYVSKTGRLYMISSNLKVMFTGCITKEKNCFDSLLDGEFIMRGKLPNRDVLFLYAAFDIYYFGGMQKDAHVRHLPFSADDDSVLEDKYRLTLLQKFHGMCKLEYVTSNTSCEFRFHCKNFEQCTETQTINMASSYILSKRYDYEVDGLIFTPMNTGVGGTKPNEAFPLGKKFTWKESFKWKPPHYNTIDFLVQIKQDNDGQDLVRYIAHDGETMMTKMTPYKTLILNVGFDKSKDKHMNIFHDVLYDNNDYFTKLIGQENEGGYEAMPFVPSDPYDPEAFLCYIPLYEDESNKLRMKTLEGDVFDGDMVVEFQYAKDDDTKQGPWKWVPLRVRQDKTQALMEGKKQFNSYVTADSNWHSIHYPVTEDIITGKETLPGVEINDTVYYNITNKNDSTAIGLRQYHNYIKRKLVETLSSYLRKSAHIQEPYLIDFSVGKGGDLAKWVHSKIRFVLGIDIHGDNITNPYNGACIRYLRHRSKNKHSSLRALFVEGNSGENIRTEGKAFKSNMEKELIQSIFGHGKNTNSKKYVFPHGMASEGFHISSCQFSLHYFFENTTVLHKFLQNVAECTRLHGYFIGTCFDGEEIFKFLYKNRDGTLIRKDESIQINKKGRKMFEITKKYNSMIQEFKADETSVGLPIQVYQESIGKTFTEYLVNFEYFIRLMEDYGFTLLPKEELHQMKLTHSSGLFKSFMQVMQNDFNKNPELQKDYGEAAYMSSHEKTVSFLNRYFIFKKMRELSKTTLTQMQNTISEREKEHEDEEYAIEPPVEETNSDVPIVLKTTAPKNKTRKKVKLIKIALKEDNYSPIDKLVFDDPEMQKFYDTFSEKRLKKMAHLPLMDQKDMVTYLWKKKQNK